jgi:uncharacterized protein YndB with AHSA1/START domain
VSYQLTVEHVFEAPAEEVFDAFTSADAQRVWLRDAGDPDAILETECDPRVGGRWVTAWGPTATSCTARPTCSRWSTGPAGWSWPRRPRR